ncbi:MAG: undecaprenyl-diphosphate phosphatase [Alphaproteobacteria bacterium]
MPLLHLFILAVIQGITEFLPVSSSAHLATLPLFLDWQDQGLLIDVAVHVGTLLAVMVYFWREVGRLVHGGFATIGLAQKGPRDEDGRLFRFVFLASIPVLAVGGALALSGYGSLFRDPMIIAIASIGFGLLLFAGDKFGLRVRRLEDLTYGSSLVVGLFQVLALIPGASRSGITMTAGRFLGFERVEAARFSMLLSIPVILAAGGWSTYELIINGSDEAILSAAMAAGMAFVTALIAIHFLMKWLERATMTIFVIYRVIFGVVVLGLLI